jgi:uncharacterized membrane protein
MPTIDSAHPIIVHFPIALLLVAPLFVVIGLVLHKRGTPFRVSALILMVLGTIGTFVAVLTGEAAGELAIKTPDIAGAIGHHEEMAERTRLFFSILTVVFAAILVAPRFVPALRKRAWIPVTATLVFLGAYMGAALLLVNTGHEGGRLVHEYGVRALLPAEDGPAPMTAAREREDD